MAHLSVVCPRCGSRYQVDPNLRGKHMRCPNAVCRAVFEVREESAAPAAPPAAPKVEAPAVPKASQVSGTVGDVVPILAAEIVEQPAAPEAPPVRPTLEPPKVAVAEIPAVQPSSSEGGATWQGMPPPVRTRGAIAPSLASDEAAGSDAVLEEIASTPSAVVGATASLDGVRDLGPGAWEVPPLRDGLEAATDGATTLTPSAPTTTVTQTKRARRRSRWLIAGLLLLLGGGLALATWAFLARRAGNEEERLKQAEKLYADKDFAEAARVLQNLQRDFPDSANLKLYRFLAELSDVREPVYQLQGDAEEAYKSFGRVMQFLELYRDDALLKAREPDVWSTLYRIAKELTVGADQTKDGRLVDRARYVLTELSKFTPPAGTHAQDTIRDFERTLVDVGRSVAARERRQGFIDDLKGLVANASARAVQQGRALVSRADLVNDPAAQSLLQELVTAHVARVVYTPVHKRIEPAAADETEPSLLIAPVRGKTNALATKNATVFGHAHGVLYALDARDGTPRWARRLGADALVPPLRLPANDLGPETVLLVSPDHLTLSAHDVLTGNVMWRHGLQAACVAPPLRAGRHLLVPTLGGRVEEIEPTGGTLLGYYQLGQPLTVGGVFDEATALAYFPAEDFCVYVLDVARKTCAGVLYSGHPVGALKVAPLLLPGRGKGSKEDGGTLLLFQAGGGREVTVRAFALPLADPDQRPLTPDLKLPGRLAFTPHLDADRLAVATDAGVLAVFGHGQLGRKQFPLFRLCRDDLVLDASANEAALIARADADNFWVATGGRLQRVQIFFDSQQGPKLVARWPVPAAVGAPLLPAQALADSSGHTTLFLNTHARTAPTCFVHAVDAAGGTARWQRQLGLLCEEAIALGDGIAARDHDGFYVFDRDSLRPSPGNLWQHAASGRIGLRDAEGSRFLVHDGDAYLVRWSKSPPAIEVIPVAAGERDAVEPVALPAAVAGPPALGKDAVVVALTNGLFVRVSPAERKATPGPNWPAADVEDAGPRYVTYLGAGDFLATDGQRGLKVYRWPQAEQVAAVAGSEHKLPQRIAAPPVVLGDNGAPPFAIAVADASGTVHLLKGPPWTTVRAWPLGGKITAGPFVRGKHLACVVDQRRVVWLDPERGESAWEYTSVADVVGAPLVLGDLVVLANVAGQFLGLDAAGGNPRGSYTLRANVAAAIGPVTAGPDRLFAPLTDGTVLLLSLGQLQ